MSIKAIDWAKSVKAGGAGAKLALLLLADHMNEKTNECFPSIPTLAIEMECSENTVRSALKKLREHGLVSWVRRGNGETVERTDYVLNIGGGEALQRTPSKIEPTSNSAPPSKIEPPSNSEGEGVQILNPPPSNSEGLPLQILNPKQEVETGNETGRLNSKAHASRSLPVAPPPPGFDDEAEAEWNDLTARAALEADSMTEDVFSPDAQTPCENIEILNATTSDSIFGTDTPPNDQNAAERKSEAISKPKRKRVSFSVVKDKPEDISQEVWDDWLTTRRAKRLPLTQTALNSVRREAASAGLTFQAAVTFAVEQGWGAFRAEWYRNATRKGDSTKTNVRYLTAQERYEERMRKAGEMSDEEYFAQFDLPEEILNYEKAQEAKRHVAS